MRKAVFTILLLVFVVIAAWILLRNEEKKETHILSEVPQAEKLKLTAFSDSLNLKLESVIQSYLALKDAFIQIDTTLIKANASHLVSQLQLLNLKEMEAQQALYLTAQGAVQDMMSNAQSILVQSTTDEMQRDFNALTNVMYPAFFQSIGYSGNDLYVYQCMNAFGASPEPATWITDKRDSTSPYKKECGVYKDKLPK